MSDKYPVTKYSVTLAPVTKEDHALLSLWISSPVWVYASGVQGRMSAAALKAFLNHVDQADGEFFLVCAPDGQAIGMVSCQPTGTPGNYVLGTIIGDPDMWGAGFGFEATTLAVGMLFDSKRAHRVEFIFGAFNRRVVSDICSGGLITVEGILRDYFFLDGEYHDALIGSILRDEYYALRDPSEAVPAEDKAEARRIIADFIEKNPIGTQREIPAAPNSVGSKHV